MDAGALIGNAVAKQLRPVFDAIQRALVKRCAVCLGRRIAWEKAHADVMEMAWLKACAERGIDDAADPRAPGVDFIPHLPAQHQPGDPADPARVPLIALALTTAAGWDVCAECLPGIVSEATVPARPVLAAPNVSAATAAKLAAQ